jgi:hypothetical protein
MFLSEIKSAFLADIPGGASRRFKGAMKRGKINNFRHRELIQIKNGRSYCEY